MSELSTGWIVASIGELGIWRGGGTPSKANSAFWKDGDIPWVSPKDMKRFFIGSAEDQITAAAVAGSATQLIPKGSILLVTRSGILRHTLPVAVNTREVAINQDLKALSPNASVDPVFIGLQMRSLAEEILATCAKSGTTVDSIDFERLKTVSVCVPPLPEQRRIVAKIDSLSGKSQRVRDHLDHIPRLVKKYKQAILAAAFRGELTQELRKKAGANTPSFVPLNEICTSITDGDHQAPPRAETGIPFITISAMNEGVIDLRKVTRFVPRSYFDDLQPNRLASEAISARKLIGHLDQAILGKAFRGELVPQDPNDEPASALLERIQAERAKTSVKPSKRTRLPT
jgi:hypothetical protein